MSALRRAPGRAQLLEGAEEAQLRGRLVNLRQVLGPLREPEDLGLLGGGGAGRATRALFPKVAERLERVVARDRRLPLGHALRRVHTDERIAELRQGGARLVLLKVAPPNLR